MAQTGPTGSCSQRADVTIRPTAGDYLQTAPTTRRTVMSAIHTPTATVQPATMTIPEVARLLGISRSAAYRAVARGEIPTIRIGRRLLVPTAKLYAMLGWNTGPTE
jgi:excisionase family DNA binding protein